MEYRSSKVVQLQENRRARLRCKRILDLKTSSRPGIIFAGIEKPWQAGIWGKGGSGPRSTLCWALLDVFPQERFYRCLAGATGGARAAGGLAMSTRRESTSSTSLCVIPDCLRRSGLLLSWSRCATNVEDDDP
jgi:hypothetical protein